MVCSILPTRHPLRPAPARQRDADHNARRPVRPTRSRAQIAHRGRPISNAPREQRAPLGHTTAHVGLIVLAAALLAGMASLLGVFSFAGPAPSVADAAPPAPPFQPAPAPITAMACTDGNRSAYGQPVVVAQGDWICGDADAYGGNVTVDGHVSGNASAFGGNVIVSGQVDGNVVAVAGNVTLEPGAHVGGDVQSWGGSVRRDAGTCVSGNVDREQWMPSALGRPWASITHGGWFP